MSPSPHFWLIECCQLLCPLIESLQASFLLLSQRTRGSSCPREKTQPQRCRETCPAAGGEPLNPEQLDHSLTVLLRHKNVQGWLCALYRTDPVVSVQSRGGMGLKDTLPHPKLFTLPGRLSPSVQGQHLPLCEALSQNPGPLKVPTASVGGINPSKGNQS